MIRVWWRRLRRAELVLKVAQLDEENNGLVEKLLRTSAENTRLREHNKTLQDALTASAAECACGGDTELYWRKRSEEDRRNAVRLTDENERLRHELQHRAVTA